MKTTKELCAEACKTTNYGKGHSLFAIKKYVAANNGKGKCMAWAVRKALADEAWFTTGSTKARWVATAVAKEAIAPKPKK